MVGLVGFGCYYLNYIVFGEWVDCIYQGVY